MLSDVSLSNIIMDKSQAKATKAKINGTIATKNCCSERNCQYNEKAVYGM